MLRDRGKAMVQLQPGGAAALVPAGVDSKGGGAQGPPSALHHGGQPGAGRGTRARYRSMYYAGVFYQRYILGLWVMSEGLIYDMFDQTENVYRTQERPVDLEWVSQRTVACDYGTANPTVFLDIYDHDGVIRVDREYRWDSRKERRQKTDQEYADDLLDFLGREWCAVIVDPSAASFIEELRRRGVYVIPAENEVLDGIRKTGSLFHRRKFWSVKPVPACWTNWAPICGTRRRASGGMRSP